MEETKKNNIPVFNMRLAGMLMSKGFKLMDVAVNTKYPTLKVFFFMDTPEFREALNHHVKN